MSDFRLKIFDFYKGLSVSKTIAEYNRIKSYTPEKIAEIQFKKLKNLLSFAYENVPYYKELFTSLNLKVSEINDKEDLKKIPPLTREIVSGRFNDLISVKHKREVLSCGSTSGTTGIPMKYCSDRNGLSAGIGSSYFFWIQSGWSTGSKKLHIWGNTETIKSWKRPASKIKRWLFNTIYYPSNILDSDRELKILHELIISSKPEIIDGYPTAIYNLAKYLANNNLPPVSCRLVISTAENLPEYQRELISKYLGPVIDFYGTGEINGIASQIIGDDRYYISEPHVLINYEENTNGSEAILTDLDNYAMPFINYKPGDIIDRIYDADESCSLPFKYFKKLEGRASDIIKLSNGIQLAPISLMAGTLFRKFPEIERHKVVWDGQKLSFLFEVRKKVSEPTRLEEELKEIFFKYDLELNICFVNKILPSLSGKMKYFEVINPHKGENISDLYDREYT